MDTHLLILDEASIAAEQCKGPAADGSCPRVTIGHLLPCAGHLLVPEGAGKRPYPVSHQATLCPVTLAAALALPSDSDLV